MGSSNGPRQEANSHESDPGRRSRGIGVKGGVAHFRRSCGGVGRLPGGVRRGRDRPLGAAPRPMVAHLHRCRGGAGNAQRARCAGGVGRLRSDTHSDLPRRPGVPRALRHRVSRHPGRRGSRTGVATARGGGPPGSGTSRSVPSSGAAAVAGRDRTECLGRDPDGARAEGLACLAAHRPCGIGSDRSGTSGG